MGFQYNTDARTVVEGRANKGAEDSYWSLTFTNEGALNISIDDLVDAVMGVIAGSDATEHSASKTEVTTTGIDPE